MASGAHLDPLRPAGPATWAELDAAGVVVAGEQAADDLAGAAVGTRWIDRLAPPAVPRLQALLRTDLPGVGGDDRPAPVVVGGHRVDGTPFVCWVERSPVPGGDGHGSRLLLRRAGGPVRRRAEGAGAIPADVSTDGRGIDSVLSHDLRGALRQATGFVTVVRRQVQDRAPAQETDHLGIALRSLANADALADAVVRWLRLGDAAMDVRPTSVSALVVSARERLVERVGEMEAARVALAGADASVVVDPDVAVDGLVELLANAVTFWPGADAVAVLAETVGGWCSVRVHDEGPGVAPDVVAAAFAPGRMLQPRGAFPGVGMGLAIAEVAALRHGGWCALEDRADGAAGTIAVLGLPVG